MTAVVLRAFSAADAGPLAACSADPTTALWNPGPADGDVEAWWCARHDLSDGTHRSWAVAEPDGRLLGAVSLFHPGRDEGTPEVGVLVVPDARGAGVARAAPLTAAREAFAGLAVRVQLFHAWATRPCAERPPSRGSGTRDAAIVLPLRRRCGARRTPARPPGH